MRVRQAAAQVTRAGVQSFYVHSALAETRRQKAVSICILRPSRGPTERKKKSYCKGQPKANRHPRSELVREIQYRIQR
jgi:hypothetical protein